MIIKPVTDVLPDNLVMPNFNALIPNEDNYNVLLMQPYGDIAASAEGVWNRDRDLAFRQYSKFLDDAKETNADLVITPEYSLPWHTLTKALREGKVPELGKLWVLGCESIKLSELESLKQEIAPFAMVIHEPIDAASTRFVSALAYVFIAPFSSNNSEVKSVILLQFKTHPMGDPDHFEINGMQRGTCIYQFGGNEHNLKLVSLICADAFAFNDTHAATIHDRALILHIQMNQNPRHEWFLECRERLLRHNGDTTEIICLNWAADVNMSCDAQTTCWKNIAGSAWYLKAKEFDDRDTTLINNHRHGLYYTWLEPRRTHALYFNYGPATYSLTATKVAHIGVAGPVARRRGPQLDMTCIWNDITGEWVELSAVEDGFSTVVSDSGNAKNEIKRIADGNPFEAERILALCAGEVKHDSDWHKVQILDSCATGLPEIIRRVTFAQDTHEQAIKFRTTRLRRCARLWDILINEELPPAISDLKLGFSFKWTRSSPHQNVVSIGGGQPATVVYMGEDCNTSQIEAMAMYLAKFIHKSSSGINDSWSAQQRLHIWFRDENGAIVLYKPHRYVKLDQVNDVSPFDIGREN